MRTFRLKKIPSCDETGWTHKKILNLINYPDDVAAKMEEHSVYIYDPRWPIDNSWIPPPEPDTWTFLKEIGRGTDEPEEDVKLRARIAAKNGIIQRFDDEEEADAFEYLRGCIRGEAAEGGWTSERRMKTTTTDLGRRDNHRLLKKIPRLPSCNIIVHSSHSRRGASRSLSSRSLPLRAHRLAPGVGEGLVKHAIRGEEHGVNHGRTPAPPKLHLPPDLYLVYRREPLPSRRVLVGNTRDGPPGVQNLDTRGG